MKLRKSRIAWSVFWGLACVLLVVLWVRSYDYADVARIVSMRYEGISVRGRVKLSRLAVYLPAAQRVLSYPVGERPADAIEAHVKELANRAGFGVLDHRSLLLPHWSIVCLTAIVAAIPWLPWWSKRFSLRTLLIATTLVAVVLGLAMWMASK